MKSTFSVFLLISLTSLTCIQNTERKEDILSENKPDNLILADADATPETFALFYNLKKLAPDFILFGHQDATAYGIGWKNEDLRSDVHDVCGYFPALYGWDIGKIGSEVNIDTVNFERMKFWIRSAYERGGINTISWHTDNPVSGGSTWDVTKAVNAILPGGEKHEFYKKKLDLVAEFFRDLKTREGVLIPVIFRPFHESNGHWFWWGNGHCTDEEYILLFRFTVNYLKNENKIHNLLYAYSPDIFGTEENYLKRFPGIEYVDILGYDNYHYFSSIQKIPAALNELRIVVSLAERMNKIPAFTETGLERIPISNWWTEYLLEPLKTDTIARKIAYIMVWRNDRPEHFYAPYPGQISAADFVKFAADSFTLFEENLPDVYSLESENEPFRKNY